MSDISQQLIEQVNSARSDGRKLNIIGRGSKSFYGRTATGDHFNVAEHNGIVNYHPAELVLTARAGTSIAELEAALDKEGQMLSFEPSNFGSEASIGGTLACNLSGPSRPWGSSVRDMVLGLRLINGRGEHLRFGGQVMKNVAGYDVARVQAGAMGCLGAITEISLKVLPKPAAVATAVLPLDSVHEAIAVMNDFSRDPAPMMGACWLEGQLYIRYSGAGNAVDSAINRLIQQYGEANVLSGDVTFWRELREQSLAFFAGDRPLWRFSVASTLNHFMPEADWLIDWGGAQRWLRGDFKQEELQRQVESGNGQVSLFRHGNRDGEVFFEHSEAIKTLHHRLKASFDPDFVFNPGRLYRWL